MCMRTIIFLDTFQDCVNTWGHFWVSFSILMKHHMRFRPVWENQCLWCITHDCTDHEWTLISLFITNSWWPSWDTVLCSFQNCRSFVLFQSRDLNSVAFHFHRVTFQSVPKCESHDCLLIGQSTPVLITSWRWIDRLTPQDYCGFICSCT